MIRELSIKNLALIESMHLEFNEGFTVFTGETGAGKSILIGAIGLLLGDRASQESVRSGCEEAEVSGVFEFTAIPATLKTLLDELSIDSSDNQLIVRRRISRSDRSRIHINETSLSLAALKRIGSLLVDMHGQHEHQSLLDETTHRTFIDRLDGVVPQVKTYTTAFTSYAEATAALARFTQNARLLREKREMLEFQVNELDHAHLKSGEEEELEAELALLMSSAQRIASVSAILDILSAPGSTGMEKQAQAVKRHLEQLSRYDQNAVPWIDEIESAARVLTELESYCSSYAHSIGEEAAPDRIEKINGRLAKIQRLKKKYQGSVDDLIAKMRSIKSELSTLENSDAETKELTKKVSAAKALCSERGKELGDARKKSALRFDALITALMTQLGFNGGSWRTVFTPLPEPGETGCETVRFFVQTNPGEPELPLAATASGGEISRLMLAIKSILAQSDYVPVLIFDEIDTGIGGTIARHVGTALQKLSTTHQVLCISHLHQIAALADHHIRVFKDSSGERTITRIVELDAEERIDEIARMLGGDTKIALQHAVELLKKRHTAA